MNKHVLLVICLSIFTSVLGQGLVVPLLPVYANSMDASGFIIGIIFGIFSISRSIFLPVFGKLSDKNGRKPFIVWGLLCYFLASIAYMASHSVHALVLIRFLQGIASAMVVPVAQAYAAEITPSGTEGRIMGLVNISLYFGLSVGPIFGGTIKETLGIKSAFAAMGLVCLVGFILSIALLPPVSQENSNARTSVPRSYRSLIRNPNIVGVFTIRFSYMACVGSVWSFLPLVAETQYGMSSAITGVLISLLVVTSAVLALPVGALADKANKRALVYVGGVITLAGIWSLCSTNSNTGLFIAIIFFGIGGGVLTTVVTAMSAVIGKSFNSTGSVMSLLMAGHSAGMFTGPLLSGMIIDFTGSINKAFEISGTILLISLMVAWLLTRNYQKFETSSR